jgi:hypothetical protein
LKMNPNKCAFGVLAGLFMGFFNTWKRNRGGPKVNQCNWQYKSTVKQKRAPVINWQNQFHQKGLYLIC